LEYRLLQLPAISFDLVIYNAGMDPWEGDAVGALPGMTGQLLAHRERLVFAWAKSRTIPVAFVLAGGYGAGPTGQGAVVALHRMTLRAAVR
jgi:acetoin utilization deacetylase AcuC-like enzyme